MLEVETRQEVISPQPPRIRILAGELSPHKTNGAHSSRGSRQCPYHSMAFSRDHHRDPADTTTAEGSTCRLRSCCTWHTEGLEPRRVVGLYDWSTLEYLKVTATRGQRYSIGLSPGLELHGRLVKATGSRISSTALFPLRERVHVHCLHNTAIFIKCESLIAESLWLRYLQSRYSTGSRSGSHSMEGYPIAGYLKAGYFIRGDSKGGPSLGGLFCRRPTL